MTVVPIEPDTPNQGACGRTTDTRFRSDRVMVVNGIGKKTRAVSRGGDDLGSLHRGSRVDPISSCRPNAVPARAGGASADCDESRERVRTS